jgi:hypothetical protein
VIVESLDSPIESSFAVATALMTNRKTALMPIALAYPGPGDFVTRRGPMIGPLQPSTIAPSSYQRSLRMPQLIVPPQRPAEFHLNHDSAGLDAPVLCCPECSCPYVHIAEADIDQRHVRAIASCDNIAVQPGTRRNGHKGSTIKLSFFCEYGHWFEYEFEFLKGNTFVRLSTADLREPEQMPELWRD